MDFTPAGEGTGMARQLRRKWLELGFQGKTSGG